MSTPLVFIDTETDGIHPDRKVWEVAMIRRDQYGQREYHAFIDIDLETADPFGLKVGGFYKRHPVGAWIAQSPNARGIDWMGRSGSLYQHIDSVMLQREAAHRIAAITHGAHLVGAVPHFDAEVLANLLRRNGLTPSWHYHLIDVEAMAVGYISARDKVTVVPPWKSDDLGSLLGIEPPSEDERHTAMGDARWAMRWYDLMTGAAA